MLKIGCNAKVTKLNDKGNFLECTLYTSRKAKEDFKTSFFNAVFWGKSYQEAKKLGDKSKIKILDFSVTAEPYTNKEGKSITYTKFFINNFEIIENTASANQQAANDIDDMEMPF